MSKLDSKGHHNIDDLLEELSYLREQNKLLMEDLENKDILMHKFKYSEQQLRSILNSSQQAYVLMDTGGIIREFNKTANDNSRRLSGMDMHTGQPIFNFLLGQHHIAFEDNFNKALDGEHIRQEVFLPGIRDESFWYAMCFSPVYSDNGKVKGVLFCSYDITAQKCMELALRDINDDLSDFIELLDCVVFFARIDAEGNVIRSFLSPSIENATGHSRDYFLRDITNFYRIIHPEDYEMIHEKFKKILQGEHTLIDVEFRIIRADESECPVNAKLAIKRFDNNTMRITAVLWSLLFDKNS